MDGRGGPDGRIPRMALENTAVGLIGSSPFARQLGIHVEAVGEGHVRARLPFAPRNVTIGEQVHGGALASLVDVAATAAAWCSSKLPQNPRGTTIGFQIQFLSGARAEEVVVDARVVTRGNQITIVEVDGRGADGRAVVKALVTYKLSGDKPAPPPAELLTGLFAGKSLDEQKALLATLERAAAGLYRQLAQAETDAKERDGLLESAEREEANARQLEGRKR
jgi:uncharacterized protein (TIGR00369 family)